MSSDSRVRVLPLQPRGKQSVGRLLDSTGALIDEVGFERLTTQLVAKRSGVSIGLVYHYFPDRLALVQALIARNFERFIGGVVEMLDRPDVVTWREALNGTIDVFVLLYRTEPGFAKVGFADRFLAAQNAPAQTDNAELARGLLDLFQDRFGQGRPEDPQLLLRFEVMVELGDALIARAFRYDSQGDERFIGQAREIMAGYLAPFLDGDF